METHAPKQNMLIAGSRSINNIQYLENCMKHFFRFCNGRISLSDIKTVTHGNAPGVDRLGGRWAFAAGKHVNVMPADWDKHGKRAGYLRNEEMAKVASFAVILWDGQSRGTKHMINIMLRQNKMVFLYRMGPDSNFVFKFLSPTQQASIF